MNSTSNGKMVVKEGKSLLDNRFTPFALLAVGIAGGYLIWRNRSRLKSAVKNSVDYVSPYMRSARDTLIHKKDQLMKDVKDVKEKASSLNIT